MILLFLLSLIQQLSYIFGQDGETLHPIDPIPIDPVIYCGYGNQGQCLNDPRCWWDPTLYCGNKLNCSNVPLSICEETKFCHLIPPTSGFCSGPPAHCSSFNLKQCLQDPYCFWTSSYQCIPKDPMPPFPNCASFNPIQCLKNAEYCNLSGSCYDNKKFCSALNYKQCLVDPACKYIWTQKEQCLNNPNYCTALNEKDCLNNKLCLGLYTAPQCQNKFECNGLNYDQCKLNNNFCSIIQTPFTCTPKKNICGSQTTPESCKAAGCQSQMNAAGQFSCIYAYPCASYNEEQCKANDVYCNYTPGTFQCKNNVDCTQISDPNECELNKYCTLIPSIFKCFSKNQNCPQLSGVDCQNNPSCIYIAAQGYCTQANSFGCNSLSVLNCYQNKHCLLKFSCTPKKIPDCNKLSLDDCKKSSYCQLIDKGSCHDLKINCSLPFKQCILTKPCIWHPGTSGQCVNDFECGGLSEDECKKFSIYCNLTVGGCKGKIK